MNDKAYSSYAFHPYRIENWNRKQVYQYMGFEQITSIEDMDNPELLYGKPVGEWTYEDHMKMYITPFIIWTNYDIEEQTIDKCQLSEYDYSAVCRIWA